MANKTKKKKLMQRLVKKKQDLGLINTANGQWRKAETRAENFSLQR